MAEIFKKRIVKLLKHADYTPVKVGQLAKTLGVKPEDYAQFKSAFDQLRQVGHVVIGAGNLVSLPAISGRITGTFRGNVKGFGFVTMTEAKKDHNPVKGEGNLQITISRSQSNIS